MSKLTSISTKLAIGGLAIIALAGGATAFATSNSTAVQDAINNKDLGAYKTALIQKATDRGNSTTQEELNKMSDRMATKKAELLKLDDAVKNNNLEDYKTAVKAHEVSHQETEKTELNPDGTPENHPQRPALTDDQIKARFDTDRKAYEADNTVLPSTRIYEGKGMGMRGGNKHGRGR
jgi:hypothetical protein